MKRPPRVDGFNNDKEITKQGGLTNEYPKKKLYASSAAQKNVSSAFCASLAQR
jgi:hypothetical protein